jgi:hypothetical protein
VEDESGKEAEEEEKEEEKEDKAIKATEVGFQKIPSVLL